MSKTETLDDFLAETKLKATAFAQINISWEDLQEIGAAHTKNFKALESIGKTVAATLHDCPEVHSVKSRVKSPTSVMEKIARKKIERLGYIKSVEALQLKVEEVKALNLSGTELKAKLAGVIDLVTEVEKKIERSEKWEDVNVENYLSVITDLVGVRALHLYSSDCFSINSHILKTWDKKPDEDMLVFVRKGDDVPDELKDSGRVEPHPHGYRSIHHIIQSKPENKIINVEIQVRTIFQEGWSEIHHRLTYKKQDIDPNIEVFLSIFNLFAGGADVMGSYARDLSARLDANRMDKESLIKSAQEADSRRELERGNLNKLVDELSNSNNETEKQSIKRKISDALTIVVGGQAADARPSISDRPPSKKSKRPSTGTFKKPSPYGPANDQYLSFLASQKSLNDKIGDALGIGNNPLTKLGINDWDGTLWGALYGKASKADLFKSAGLDKHSFDSASANIRSWLDSEIFSNQFEAPSYDHLNNNVDNSNKHREDPHKPEPEPEPEPE